MCIRDRCHMRIAFLAPSLYFGAYGIDEIGIRVGIWHILVCEQSIVWSVWSDAYGCGIRATAVKHIVIIKVSVEVGSIVPAWFVVRIVEYRRFLFHKLLVAKCSLTPQNKAMIIGYIVFGLSNCYKKEA